MMLRPPSPPLSLPLPQVRVWQYAAAEASWKPERLAQELVHKARGLMKITKGLGEALEVVSRADVVLGEL